MQTAIDSGPGRQDLAGLLDEEIRFACYMRGSVSAHLGRGRVQTALID